MPVIVLASDAPWLLAEIGSVLRSSTTSVAAVRSGAAVRAAVLQQRPDLVILDMQIGNMGGVAACIDLRLEEGAGRLPQTPALILLDRRADVFMARRSGAEGWLLKPLDPLRLRRAVQALIGGGTYYDESYLPNPVVVGPAGMSSAG